jgi:tRNA 2-thiouridine synthesizing protein A
MPASGAAGPYLRAARRAGDHLIASDPAAPIDLPAWCHLTGYTYLGPIPAATRPTYALRAIAAPAATDPASPWRHRNP